MRNTPLDPMDIRFCDLCNESVPVSDFANGVAYVRGAKVICATCERAMGGGSTSSGSASTGSGSAGTATLAPAARPKAKTAPQPNAGQRAPYGTGAAAYGAPRTEVPSPPVEGRQKSRAGAAALFVAVGGLAALGTGGLMLAERLDGVEFQAQASARSSAAAMDQLRVERASLIAPLQGRIQEAQKVAGEAAAGVREETTTEMAALHARLATAEARSLELRSALDSTRQQLEALRSASQSTIDSRNAEIASLQKVVQFHGDSLLEMRERIREAGALVASGQMLDASRSGAPGTPGAGAGQAPGAAWAGLLPDLANPDEAMRLTAVLELGETGDPAVAEHILPMLKDTDSFVRMVTVQALGDLGYKPAVPSLIDRLGDDRWTVREAARDALRTITGKNFGFDPTVREAEMKKKIDQWRTWWRREGDNFLTQG